MGILTLYIACEKMQMKLMVLRRNKNSTSSCHHPGCSLGLNARALRPVVFFGALSFFLTALSFSESLLVSSGFHQRYFELEVAERISARE